MNEYPKHNKKEDSDQYYRQEKYRNMDRDAENRYESNKVMNYKRKNNSIGGKLLKLYIKLLPHINIAFAGMYITFHIIDIYNPAMGFIDSSITKNVLLLLAIGSIVSSVLLIAHQRKN